MALMGQPPQRQEPPVRLRSYQQEMLEWSLKQNVIIAMDTGSGKTHVAIQRIAEELKYRPDSLESSHKGSHQIVWFMCPSVALCLQQYDVLAEHLPGYLIKTLTGSDGVDRWSTQDPWDGFLTNTRVVVCTPKVLEEALTHGFVNIRRISLLVFDEAHRCIKGSPMNVIMQRFYHPAKREGSEQIPHILGLTASPIMSEKSSSLETIESNLDAKAITPKLHRSELERFVHPPEIVRVSYRKPAAGHRASSICAALKRSIASYDMFSDPYVRTLLNVENSDAHKRLEKQLQNPSTHCLKQLKMLHQRADTLNEQLGSTAVDWYVEQCIRRYSRREVYQSLLPGDIEEQEKQHLRNILLQIGSSDASEEMRDTMDITEKVLQLVQVLGQTDSHNTRVIIFVEQRATVCALAELLRNIQQTSPSWSVGSFVGTSSFAKRSTNLADLADPKDQTQDLNDFRSGSKNLIIATSVLEEGIDVSACNVVICFDLPKNLVSFIQRRGRARKRDSKYVLFVLAEEAADPMKWETLEAEMKQAYMDDTREHAMVVVGDGSMPEREYRISATGALLTTTNAKAHLYHFCSVSSLHTRRLVDARPIFATASSGDPCSWTATVTLPSFLHRSLRTASTSRSCSSEASAIKDAAFEAYVKLHKEGVVNDNLLPLRDDPEFEAIEQPSMVDVHMLKNPWKKMSQGRPLQWREAVVSIISPGSCMVSANIHLPVELPTFQSFSLYWNEETTYTVDIQPSTNQPLADDSQQLEAIRIFTTIMLQSVHKDITDDQHNSPVLVSPAMNTEELTDLIKIAAKGPMAFADLPAITNPIESRLVRVRSQGGKAYMLSGVNNEHPGEAPKIELTAFPKRKDFIHPVQKNDNKAMAYTAVHSFDEDDCEFDRLPGQYAMLAAFVPSIIHRLSIALVAEDLRRNILQQMNVQNLSLLVEAISCPVAQEAKDYNRLEFLGDSILKFCATLQVMAQHLNWPEGYLTAAKGVIVSNNSLTKAALAVKLDQYVLTERFTGKKWKPPTAESSLATPEMTQRQISSKTIADVVEALIGASYVEGGLGKAYDCLRVLLPEHEWIKQADCIDRLLSDVDEVPQLDLQLLEALVGHEFTLKALLLEAVTHASASGSVPSYERLEFLGDAVLDLLIVPKVFAHAPQVTYWEMHRIRSALTNRHFLGYCCMRYSFDQETSSVVFDQSDAKKKHPKLSSAIKTVHLHDFMQADVSSSNFKAQSLKNFDKYRSAIEATLEEKPLYPWDELVAMNPSKPLSDLVESVLAAIYLDTKGDLGACEAFLHRLGIFKVMNRILDERIETAVPQEKAGKKRKLDRAVNMEVDGDAEAEDGS